MQTKSMDWKTPSKPTTTSKKCLVPFLRAFWLEFARVDRVWWFFLALPVLMLSLLTMVNPIRRVERRPRLLTMSHRCRAQADKGTQNTHSDHLTISCTACLDDFVKTALSKKSTKSTAEFSCLLAPISFSFAMTICPKAIVALVFSSTHTCLASVPT